MNNPASNLGTIKDPLPSDFKDGLSVIIICRNEVKNIRACLESVLPIADDVVINDTGSTDGTLTEISTTHGKNGPTWISPINLIHNEWKDDFALARNQAIDQAKHKWILWIDADDRVPEHSVEGINQLKTCSLTGIIGFQITCTCDGQPIGARFAQFRMFPNHPKMRFTRRIHEQVLDGANELGLRAIYVPAEILHTGYENREEKERKAIRNIRLSKLEKDLIGSDCSFTMNLGDAHFILKEWETGIGYYKQCLEIPGIEKISSELHSMVPYNIGVGMMHLKDYNQAISYLTQSYQANKYNLNTIYYLGVLSERMAQTDTAKLWYQLCIETPYKPQSTWVSVDSVKMFSYIKLSQIYLVEKQYKKAVELLLTAKEEYPTLRDIYKMLSLCYQKLGRPQRARKIMAQMAEIKGGLHL